VVHDTGSGIASEHISRLFDPFYTTRQDTGGTGLGLSLVHGIITDHGGTIDVRSTLGHSTTVRIKLPLELSAHDMPHGE
jgi:signal transduction histidine kinase